MKTKLYFSSPRLDQRGDTLIEIIMATVIAGAILTGAYGLSIQAFKLGQEGRERTQATQILQRQAEGLRSLRASMAWQDFRARIPSGTFHIAQNPGNQWQINGGALNAGIYRVAITGSISGTSPAQVLQAQITITWPPLGGGPTNTSTLYTHLADQSTPIRATP